MKHPAAIYWPTLIFRLGKRGASRNFLLVVIYKFRNLNTGQAMPIPPGEFIVGRADEAYIHLEDGSVSRRHAKISNLDGKLFVEDLGSSNGTASHGAFIRGRLELKFGDQIHIGSVPFRVDPEVPGEVMDEPSAGLRLVSRPYMSRETERLTVTGGTLRRSEPVAADKLAAPEVSTATDLDAEDLNAITLREPEPAPTRLPAVRPGLTPLAKESPGLSVISVGTSPTFSPPRPQPQEPLLPRASTATTSPSPVTASRQEKSSPAEKKPEAASGDSKLSWFLLFFFAGLGVGLLLGLYFAKLFIEMGGKAALLP